jgi:ketosteroid isomerase-like protein
MKTRFPLQTLAVALPLLCFCLQPANAQEKIASLEEIKSQAELDKTITALDAELFSAYNRCDLAKFSSLVADDVEFFHDQGGVTLGRDKLTESVKNNICPQDVQHELVPGTLKIYYMKGYGAIEMDVHRFLHPKTKNPPGEASFVHLWQYKDLAWKVSRVLSYEHHEVQGHPKQSIN